MSDTEDLTKSVRSMYEEFPFPNTEYRMPIRHFAAYFAKHARKGGRSLLGEGVTVTDFGCGTAAFIRALAKSFPESQFTGFDMTTASLNLARKYAAEAGLQNIAFEQGNILEVDLGRKFDVVMNLGVLHHLADPPRGLARIVSHMKDDGFLVLWLYGKHGRYRLNLNQNMIGLLTRPEDDWKTRVDLAKRVLTTFPDKYIQCAFSVADQRLEDDFQKSREWILQHDQWVADQFVHPNERVVDMDDIYGLLDGVGLKLDLWLTVDEDPAKYTSDPEIQGLIAKLSLDDRRRFIDRLIKPNDYFVIARRK